MKTELRDTEKAKKMMEQYGKEAAYGYFDAPGLYSWMYSSLDWEHIHDMKDLKAQLDYLFGSGGIC